VSRFTPGGNPNAEQAGTGQSTNWRSSDAKYHALHRRVEVVRGVAREHQCDHCDVKACDWALVHGRDANEIMAYIPLCRRCHIAYDIDSHSRKLNPEKVIAIRARRAEGETLDFLAREYGVCKGMVSRIVRRLAWRHVP
jgi:hypothetical protein